MAAAPTLLGGIQAKLDGSAVYASLTDSGGVWFGGVPEDQTVLPYLAVVHHGEVPLFDPGAGLVEVTGRFDLVLVGRNPLSAVEALAAQVKTLFDPTITTTPWGFVELDVTGYAVSWVRRLDYVVRRLPKRAADGAYVFEITMPYEAKLEGMRS